VKQHGSLRRRARGLRQLSAFLGTFSVVGSLSHGSTSFLSPIRRELTHIQSLVQLMESNKFNEYFALLTPNSQFHNNTSDYNYEYY
jgi:hypothetical protein